MTSVRFDRWPANISEQRWSVGWTGDVGHYWSADVAWARGPTRGYLALLWLRWRRRPHGKSRHFLIVEDH